MLYGLTSFFIDFVFSVLSTQADVSEIQQVSTTSNHKQGNTEETRVVTIDKVIHVSEVISEKVDTLSISNQEPGDNLQSPTMGVCQYNLHRETIDQSNSSVLENKEGICKENNEHVSF